MRTFIEETDNYNEFTSYIYGYQIPMLHDMRVHGRIKKGKKTILDALNKSYAYEGELDLDGKACGIGKSTAIGAYNEVYEGMFYNDEAYGFCTYTYSDGFQYMGEWKYNRFGKGTRYYEASLINYIWRDNGIPIQAVVEADQAYYRFHRPYRAHPKNC